MCRDNSTELQTKQTQKLSLLAGVCNGKVLVKHSAPIVNTVFLSSGSLFTVVHPTGKVITHGLTQTHLGTQIACYQHGQQEMND